MAYQNLIDSLAITQEQLSERVGKKRATITNYLRLLKLPAEVQMGVKDKKIDMGHARALVTLTDPVEQLALYNKIMTEELSVRKVESLVRNYAERKNSPAGKTAAKSVTDDFETLKKHLSDYFNSDVQFTCNKQGKGRITIPFSSQEDLVRIIAIFDTIKK